MRRRDFLKVTLATTAAAAVNAVGAVTPASSSPAQGSSNMPQLPRRPYGKERIPLSIIGFGGIVVMNAPQDHANRVVARAVERGVNYFDVAPSYGDAELRLGPALRPYRKDCFLACKTGHRQATAAQQEFEGSLKRLQTDYVDLYQLHAITDLKKDVDAAFAKGGVMEFLIEAKRRGQMRHLGFSAHSVEAALAAMDRYEFDSCLVPVNFATFHKGHFGAQIIAGAQAKGLSILALKSLAQEKWPENDPLKKQYAKCWYKPLTDRREAALALRFTVNQPITALLPPGEEPLFEMALELAVDTRPLSPDEDAQLRGMAERTQPIFAAVG